MPKSITTRDLTEVEYERVTEEYKSKIANYGSNPVVKLLVEEGAILKVPLDTRTWKLNRYLKDRGYIVKRRKTLDSIIIWIEKDTDE